MTTWLFLDRSIGETRGVLMREGRPHRLLIQRDADIPCQRLGAVQVARLRRHEPGLAGSFMALESGPDALLPGRSQGGEGTAWQVEVVAAARSDKGARLKLLGPAEGPPRLLSPAPDIAEALSAFSPGAPIIEGEEAREAADEAEEAVLAAEHGLQSGGRLWIEPTRALVAVDVDLGPAVGGDPVKARRRANLSAIAETARLVRLKGLGGLIVIDLAGGGEGGAALMQAARSAFAEEGRDVAFGPLSRFGLLQISLPWTATPMAERLAGPQACALRLLRDLEREGRANPGAPLSAKAAPDVAAAVQPYLPALADRLGARFKILSEPGRNGFTVAAS